MPKVTLASIRDAADKKYGPYIIEDIEGGDVTLMNPLKLSKAKRKKLAELDSEGEVDDKLADTIRLAASAADAKRLLAAIGDDLPLLAEIVKAWGATARVGEASPSAS